MQKLSTKGENETFNYKTVLYQSTNVCTEASTENSETNQDIDNSDEEVNAPSFHTMLDNQHVDHNNVSLTLHQERAKDLFFMRPLAEYICFPTTFCGQKCPSNSERIHPIQQQDIFKYELHSDDTKVASNIPNIFWKTKHKQMKQIADKVSLAVCRNKTKGKKITAHMLLDKEERSNIVKLD